MGRSIRGQILERIDPKTEDSNTTTSRQALYGTMYIEREPIGGLQSFTMRETNGTTFIPQIGNDWLEPRMGMRQWNGEASRFALRTKDIKNIFQHTYTNLYDVDFRLIPFTLRWHQNFQSATGGHDYEDVMWTMHTVFITDYTIRVPDANNMMMEDITFIAKGLSFNGGKLEPSYAQLSYLWGKTDQLSSVDLTPINVNKPPSNTIGSTKL